MTLNNAYLKRLPQWFSTCLPVLLFACLVACGGGGTGGATANSTAGSATTPAGLRGSASETTLVVDFFRNGCVGEQVGLCLQVSDAAGGRNVNFYTPIDGFSFEWGYRYTLRVMVTTVQNPPVDSASLAYTLIEQTSRQVAANAGEFRLFMPGVDRLIEKRSPTLYALSDGKTFQCNAVDCAMLDALITQRFSALLVFELAANVDAPLVLTRIECSDAPVSFAGSCLQN